MDGEFVKEIKETMDTKDRQYRDMCEKADQLYSIIEELTGDADLVMLGWRPDLVEVLRCKDCPHNKTIECPMCESISGDGAEEKTYWNKDNDFCSYGTMNL